MSIQTLACEKNFQQRDHVRNGHRRQKIWPRLSAVAVNVARARRAQSMCKKCNIHRYFFDVANFALPRALMMLRARRCIARMYR